MNDNVDPKMSLFSVNCNKCDHEHGKNAHNLSRFLVEGNKKRFVSSPFLKFIKFCCIISPLRPQDGKRNGGYGLLTNFLDFLKISFRSDSNRHLAGKQHRKVN